MNQLSYEISETTDGTVRFRRRRRGWDDASWALQRRGRRWRLLVIFVTSKFARQLQSRQVVPFGLDPLVIMIASVAAFVAARFGLAYHLYRRAAESYVFEANRGAPLVGRGAPEIPFSRLDGPYYVADRGIYTDEGGGPIQTFAVYVRSAERRIRSASSITVLRRSS